MDEVDVGKRIWFDPDEKIYYRGSVGRRSLADFIATKGLKEVEPKYLRAAEQVLSGYYDTSHSSTIKAVIVLDRVLATEFREFRCREAFQAIRTPELVLSFDVATTFSASKRVLPLEEASLVRQTQARTTFDLAATGKNVSHVALSDEAEKQAVHDVLRLHIENAARALKKAENEQLADILEGATTITGADWGAMNTNADFSANDPLANLHTAMDAIWGNGMNPDILVLDPQPFQEFMSNTFVHNLKIDDALIQDSKVLRLAGFPDLQIIVDTELVATSAIVLSKSGYGAILADGPTEAAQYRDEIRGADGYIIRQWTEGKLGPAGASREILSVTA